MMKSPNNPETERIMAEAHALIGARIDRAMAEASRRKETNEEAQTEDPQAA